MHFIHSTVLKDIMQAQMESFVTLSAQVSVLHDGLQDLQEKILQALKDRPGVALPKFIDPYAPKKKKEKVIAPPNFEYPPAEPPPQAAGTTGFGAGAVKTGATTGFGQKPATGYGAGATTGATTGTGYGSGFGAKPTGLSFGAKTAGTTGTTGATTGFGQKPATSFGAAKSTGSVGFGARPPASGF